MWDGRGAAHIEFENARYHDNGLGPMSILKEGEPERFGAIDEQATTTMLVVLNNPVAVAVLADEEEERFRGRFLLAHDTFPSLSRLLVEVREPDRSFQCDGPGGDDREQPDFQSEFAEQLDHRNMRRCRHRIGRSALRVVAFRTTLGVERAGGHSGVSCLSCGISPEVHCSQPTASELDDPAVNPDLATAGNVLMAA
jgi:hypothetical protein